MLNGPLAPTTPTRVSRRKPRWAPAGGGGIPDVLAGYGRGLAVLSPLRSRAARRGGRVDFGSLFGLTEAPPPDKGHHRKPRWFPGLDRRRRSGA
jgi:hypothetical protein